MPASLRSSAACPLAGLATRASAGGHDDHARHADRPRGDDRRPGTGARRPADLDALLIPPAALPHKPGRVREYTLTAVDRRIEVAQGVFFEAWTYNGTVPGPIIRATEDDLLRVNFVNGGSHPHTIHFHGIHPANMDGVFEVVHPATPTRTSSRRGRTGCSSTTATRRR